MYFVCYNRHRRVAKACELATKILDNEEFHETLSNHPTFDLSRDETGGVTGADNGSRSGSVE